MKLYIDDEPVASIILWIISIAIVVIIVGLPFAIIHENNSIAEFDEICHQNGGSMIDHATGAGKYTHHEYICINSSSMINIKR